MATTLLPAQRTIDHPPAILSLIGDTPLVEVTRIDTGPCHLFLKLENQNPTGSIKDRIALSMRCGRGQFGTSSALDQMNFNVRRCSEGVAYAGPVPAASGSVQPTARRDARRSAQ